MHYLMANLSNIARRIDGRGVLLMLDYDGTLVEIAPTPSAARLSRVRRDALRRLSVNPRCRLAIITGRASRDIRELVRLDTAIYAGSHGFELEGPGVRYRREIPRRYQQTLARLQSRLRTRLVDFPRVLFEDKGLSLCVHYRRCSPAHIAQIREIVMGLTWELAECHAISLYEGKKNIEIMPPARWNKGRIVTWLLGEVSAGGAHRLFPIYLGDDATDETAFSAVRDSGLAVFVGRPGSPSKDRSSAASYFLYNVGQVYKFFSWLANRL
jgi:trehalose-phosphatase